VGEEGRAALADREVADAAREAAFFGERVMASKPAQLIEFVAKALVDHPEQVAVRESDGGRLLELETNADDRGRVIGRQGRVAKAMRALLGVSRDGADCRLDIVD
jgi:predicted RNA-binding protein YlqC (UPF0109 family)